jgi:type IV pilus assembly protein PilN
MRVDINLASRPYEDTQRFWLRWAPGVGLLGIVTLLLLAWTFSNWRDARMDRQQMHHLEKQIAACNREHDNAQALLNRPENRSIRDRSQFLNELITRKAFSWTRAFEELEQVMPRHLHLVSIQPQMLEDNQLAIKMVVGGDSRNEALQLVRRMEDSQHFKGTEILQDSLVAHTTQSPDTVRFDIRALYTSEAAPRSAR